MQIEAIGVNDYASGKAFIKQLILGEPDAGKTRYSSAYPRPLFLACEPTVTASIASRKIKYAEGVGSPRIVRVAGTARPSEVMLDALDYLKQITRGGGDTKYQTVVLDTLDGLQRLLKDEWVASENASMFTGRDAWGFIEAKLNLIITRLLNLDCNVLVLCHLKDYEIEERQGDIVEKRTVYAPFLQGGIKDSIFHDFDLIGLLKREIRGDAEYRGITYDPTPSFPFLKDHFDLEAPGADRSLGRKFWPIELNDGTKGGDAASFVEINYERLFNAIAQELDDLPDGGVVEDIPAAGEGAVLPASAPGGPVQGVVAPAPGGTAEPVKPAKAAAPKAAAKPAPAPTAEPAPPAEPPAEPAAEVPAADAQTAVPAQEPLPDPQETAIEVASEVLGGEVVSDTAAADVTPVAGDDGCAICGKDLSGENETMVGLSRLKHKMLVLPDGRKFYDTKGACEDCYKRLNADKTNKTGLYAA